MFYQSNPHQHPGIACGDVKTKSRAAAAAEQQTDLGDRKCSPPVKATVGSLSAIHSTMQVSDEFYKKNAHGKTLH
jgi:hypothetical protein